jgi:hypothetical protein
MAEAERWVADTVRWEAEAERWVTVPRQGDGWLSQRDLCHSKMDGRGREMGGYAEAERWVAEAEMGGCAEAGRWVAEPERSVSQ